MSGISIRQFVSSPACAPTLTLEPLLKTYAEMGFDKFEGFSSWCKSHLDVQSDAQAYKALAGRYGVRFSSFHLPPVTDDLEASVSDAVHAARFAQELGASVVLYKASSRENYIRGARPFLDALDAQGIRVTPVLQNHKGTPITTLDDFKAVIDGINDVRMKTLLEVGHFQRVGVSWRQGYDLLGSSIALVHINEIDSAGRSVPFGTGLVDFAGLFAELGRAGYAGEIVVELELVTRETDVELTFARLREAREYLKQFCIEGQSQ